MKLQNKYTQPQQNKIRDQQIIIGKLLNILEIKNIPLFQKKKTKEEIRYLELNESEKKYNISIFM